MNLSNKRTMTLLVVIVAIVAFFFMKNKETYDVAYRYGFVDTNPVRRTSQFFDKCSPENMEDCSRNNPYEGLPLP